jgi:plasmid stability protein
MASITLKNIPEDLHWTYKRRARQHARSLQAEILHTLRECAEEAPTEPPLRVEEVAGSIRPKKKRSVSLQEMDQAVNSHFHKKWKRTK